MADAVPRLCREQESQIQPDSGTGGGEREAKARLVILRYEYPELTSLQTAAPTLGKMSRHVLLQAFASHHRRLCFGDGVLSFFADVGVGGATEPANRFST